MEKPIEELKNQDLSPQMIAKFTKPKKTWFIKRVGDGKIFAMEEQEAWNTLTNRSGWVRTDFRIVGVSSGETYYKIVKEAKGKSQKIRLEIEAIEREANKYRKTEERFVFEELLDPTDEKVKKVRAIIMKYDKELEKKNKEYLAMTSEVAKTAFEAELAVARKNPRTFPNNQDIITPGANSRERTKIINKMG